MDNCGQLDAVSLLHDSIFGIHNLAVLKCRAPTVIGCCNSIGENKMSEARTNALHFFGFSQLDSQPKVSRRIQSASVVERVKFGDEVGLFREDKETTT